MKKIYLLMMLLATVFVACSDDDEKDDEKSTTKQKLVSKLIDDYGDGETCTTTFEYDSEGKMTKVVETYKGGEDDGRVITTRFKKEGNKLVATWDTNDEDWDESRVFECELNDKELVTKAIGVGAEEYESIDYTENNQLISTTGSKFSCKWLNGNITSLECYGTRTYTYTDYENKSNYDFNWQLIQVWEYDFMETSYFGVKSKNLIASMKEGNETYTYEYTFDKNGYVTTIKTYDERSVKKLESTTTVTYKE
ncbi:hypothetical protein [Butyricimonas sp. Marseille-P3923]|uniref:hypothetical protein n=1 Tax=Butyricimonas sp. Marseille-P3923 TaxID=1987504 RepID=UPI000C07066A|nr:hypothetical protein [Butyricimonas sp. Marseille-P3923]